jgi:hypothetical protein
MRFQSGLWASSFFGFVAKFAQEVVKESWPLSAGGFGGQGVAQGGPAKARVSLLKPQLSLPAHGQEVDADARGLRRGKRFASSPSA